MGNGPKGGGGTRVNDLGNLAPALRIGRGGGVAFVRLLKGKDKSQTSPGGRKKGLQIRRVTSRRTAQEGRISTYGETDQDPSRS